MVSIEFGGGPSIEQRRKFSTAQDRAHIAGYMGFCPQMKYNFGKTFGIQTGEIAKQLPYYNGPDPFPSIDIKCKSALIDNQMVPFTDETPIRMIPKARGDNKLIENLMPGYSGDIPGYNFSFGGTYTDITNGCIDKFVHTYLEREEDFKKLHETSKIVSSLVPTKADSTVKDELNVWVDDLQKQTCPSNKKDSLEPAIPGYTGYIPRERVTEAALGYRYTRGTERCLKVFDEEISSHFKNLETPAVVPALNTDIRDTQVKPKDEVIEDYQACNKRVGCIPRYTGHVPQFKYQFGNSFGNTTKKLEHCSKHP